MLTIRYCDHLTRGRGSWSLSWLSSIVITSLGKRELVAVLAVRYCDHLTKEEGAGRCAGCQVL